MQNNRRDRHGKFLKEKINERIAARQVRLIYEEKEINKVMNTSEALQMARDAHLDLVEISVDGDVSICKIIDYGKFLYHRDKKRKEAKKNQKQVLLKEIKMRPVTDVHDYNFKIKNAMSFFADGNKVKITIRFRGRELGYTEGGMMLMKKIIEDTKDVAKVESGPSMEGRDMVMVLFPLNTKKVK